MIVDTSALLAVLQNEPERRAFTEAIEAAESRSLSTGTLLECSMVIEARFGTEGQHSLDLFLTRAGIEAVPFDSNQLRVARHAFRTYGKGRHKAALNFGDCFAYALAKTRDERLLFKGDDFANTDVRPAI